MEDRFEEFRRLAGQENEGRPANRWRYAGRLRALGLDLWRWGKSQGLSEKDLARKLGVSTGTVRRWREEPQEPAGFEEVRVVGARAQPASAPRDPEVWRRLSLLTPGGYRVEGLDLDSVERLLAVLA